MMKGWKTWIAVAGMIVMGISEIVSGSAESGITKIVGALALIGLGHKIEKNNE